MVELFKNPLLKIKHDRLVESLEGNLRLAERHSHNPLLVEKFLNQAIADELKIKELLGK